MATSLFLLPQQLYITGTLYCLAFLLLVKVGWVLPPFSPCVFCHSEEEQISSSVSQAVWLSFSPDPWGSALCWSLPLAVAQVIVCLHCLLLSEYHT